MTFIKRRRGYPSLKIIAAVLLFYPGSLFSQAIPVSSDRFPDISKSHILNAVNPSSLFSSCKNKLVILDFWASWCSSCINAFPKLAQLQEKYKAQLQIILVNSVTTGDSRGEINGLIEKWEQQRKTKLNIPIVVEDTLLSARFPHDIIPHYVWFDKSGKLIGTTASDQVNASVIRDLLENKSILLNTKKDINTTNPLFIRSDYPTTALQQYSILIKGWQRGMPSGSANRVSGNITNGWAIANMPLLNIFKMIISRMNPAISPKQYVIEVKDSMQFIPPAGESLWEAWIKDHLYSVDVIVPVQQAEHLMPYMLDYMNQNSGLIATIEKRKMPCRVLRLTGAKQAPITKGATPLNDLESLVSPRLINSPVSRLIERINELEESQLAIDETGITGCVDLYFTKPLKKIETIQKDLQRNGLELNQTERVVDVVVIREKAGN